MGPGHTWGNSRDLPRDSEIRGIDRAGNARSRGGKRDRSGRPNNFTAKPVIDATNPLSDHPPVDGVLQFTTGPNESLAEKIQAKIPGAYVVKAFSSVGAARMINPQFKQGIPTMFICGNNAEAKAKVSEVIEQFGWEPFDCGTIISARAIEPLCILWCIPGFQKNRWTHAFKLLTE
jgi:8-hydroxy-5-deazaflavin:NADPH oxidoreductase